MKNWRKLVSTEKISILFLRIFILHEIKQNEKYPYAYKIGSDLASVDCTKFQFPDKEIVIGESTRMVLKDLTADQQKIALLGMRSFSRLQHHI